MRDREDATNSIKLPQARMAEYFDQKHSLLWDLDYCRGARCEMHHACLAFMIVDDDRLDHRKLPRDKDPDREREIFHIF
jgi:hypothetical protein